MVKDAPDIEDGFRNLLSLLGIACLLRIMLRFDMGFIQANCKTMGLPELQNPVLDTLELARFLFPSHEKSSIEYPVG